MWLLLLGLDLLRPPMQRHFYLGWETLVDLFSWEWRMGRGIGTRRVSGENDFWRETDSREPVLIGLTAYALIGGAWLAVPYSWVAVGGGLPLLYMHSGFLSLYS